MYIQLFLGNFSCFYDIFYFFVTRLSVHTEMRYSFVRKLSISYLILSLFSFAGNAQRQRSGLGNLYEGLYESIQETYGFDQELVNGIFFMNRYLKALGHPFLWEDQFVNGSLVYHNKVYDDIMMKYDIYEQNLLINYHFNDKQITFLVVDEFVSEFSFNDKLFRYFSFHDLEPAFFQVISGGDELKCLYHWYKERRESFHNRTFSSFEFSESSKRSYLLIQDKLIPFRNNRIFMKSFPLEVQNQIRKFIRSNKIKVRTCDDSSMLKLMNYCNTFVMQ